MPTAEAASAEVVGTMPLPPAIGDQTQGLVGAAAAYYDGYSYIFGGRTRNTDLSDVILAYNHASGETKEVGRLPQATGAATAGRFSSSAVTIGDKIYVFGGSIYVQAQLNAPPAPPSTVPQSIKDIVEFDPRTNEARKLSATLPSGLWGTAAVSNGRVGYVFGGFTFDVTQPNDIARRNWIMKFDPAGALGPQLTKLTPTLPFAIQDSAAALIGARVYVFGGLSDHDNNTNPCPVNHQYNSETGQYEDAQTTVCATDVITAFSTELNTVEILSQHLPYRAQFLSTAVVKNKAYIPGGRLQSGDASSSILEFNPSSVTPIRALTPTLPFPFFSAPATTDGNVIMLFGGRGADPQEMSSNVTRIDPRATLPWAPRAAVARDSGGSVTLTWEPPAYDGDGAITSYRVYRTLEGAAEVYLGEATILTYKDATAKPGAQYTYRITAVNSVGESPQGARASTYSGPVPPGAVTTFAVYEGNGEVLIRWTPPSVDGGSNITGYRIYRNDGAQPVLSPPPSQLEIRDTSVTNGQTYSYVIRAVNAKGEGSSSKTLFATPKNVPPAPESVTASNDPTSGIVVTWSQPPAAVKSFILLRGTNPADLSPIANLSGSTTTFADALAERGHTYYYAVQSANDIGSSAPSQLASVSLVDQPGAPVNVFAAPLEGGVRLTWQAPSSLGVTDPSQVSYYVKRDGRIVATDIKTTAYADMGILADQPHSWTIVTFNGLASEDSATVRAAAKPLQNKAPVAQLAILTSVVIANQDVIIDGSQSADSDGAIVEYVWEFGDGTTPLRTTTSGATHAYKTNGSYGVKLFVVDNKGAESPSVSALVTVGDPTDKNPAHEEGPTPTPSTPVSPPGSTAPKLLPGPAYFGLLIAVGAAALLHRRR